MLSTTRVSRPSDAPYTAAAEARGAAADHDEVDLLARCELAADAERAGNLAGRRASQLDAARQPHERKVCGIQSRHQRGRRLIVRLLRVAPGKREAIAPRELDDPHRGLG